MPNDYQFTATHSDGRKVGWDGMKWVPMLRSAADAATGGGVSSSLRVGKNLVGQLSDPKQRGEILRGAVLGMAGTGEFGEGMSLLPEKMGTQSAPKDPKAGTMKVGGGKSGKPKLMDLNAEMGDLLKKVGTPEFTPEMRERFKAIRAELEGAGTAPNKGEAILSGVKNLQSGHGNFVRIDRLRSLPEFQGMSAEEFDKAILDEAKNGKIVLGTYDGPRPIPPEDRHAYVFDKIPEKYIKEPKGIRGERDEMNVYIGAALPRSPSLENPEAGVLRVGGDPATPGKTPQAPLATADELGRASRELQMSPTHIKNALDSGPVGYAASGHNADYWRIVDWARKNGII